MAYFESLTTFSTAQAITTTANATNLYDVTGAGTGNAPAMIGAGGVNTAMGIDIGSGDGDAIPYLYVAVTVAGTGAGTITFSLAAAPDNGSYSAGSYITIYQSAAFVGTTLTKGSVLQVPVPPIPPTLGVPRFYQLTYTVSGSATATVTSALLLNPPNVRGAQLFGNNFISV